MLYTMMMETIFYIVIANIGISLLSLVGIFTITFKSLKKKSTSVMMVSFAAGALLAAAFLNILPEALEGLPIFTGMTWAMVGVVGAFLMERSLLWYHHHHDETHNINPTSLLVIFGDGIHNFIDGLAIAAAFLVHPFLGLTTTLAVAAHEIPQEIADYTILRHCGMTRKKALLWNFGSGLSSVVGGLIGFYFFRESSIMIHYALALAGGIFIYVSAADLIPELHHAQTKEQGWILQTVMFLVGILLIMIITVNTPHGHEGEAEHLEDSHIEEQIIMKKDEYDEGSLTPEKMEIPAYLNQ